MVGDEILVVLAAGDRDARARLEARHRITQDVSPRVVVIERPDDLATLRAMPGIVLATECEIPPHALSELNDSETLFANAWSARQQQGTKSRTGDGLPWDAPGHLPPDPPHTPPSRKNES